MFITNHVFSRARFMCCSVDRNQTNRSKQTQKTLIALGIILAVGAAVAFALSFSGLIPAQQFALTHKIAGSVLVVSIALILLGIRKFAPAPRSYSLAHSLEEHGLLSISNCFNYKAIVINVLTEDVETNPLIHLNQLTNKISKLNKLNTQPEIYVHFLGQKGADGGALSKQYLDTLFESLMKESGINFVTGEDGQNHPEMENENSHQRKILQKMGLVMAYCYDSDSRTDSNRSLLIGSHFNPAFYQGLFQFSSEEVNTDFESLSLRTHIKVARALQWHVHRNLIALCEKDPDAAWDASEVEEAKELLEAYEEPPYAYDLPEVLQGKSDQEIAGSVDYKHQLIESAQKLFSDIFRPRLRAMHAVAQGLKEGCLKGEFNGDQIQHDQYWDSTFIPIGAASFELALQGITDRNTIVDNIFYGGVDISNGVYSVIGQKARWIKEWIRGDDPNFKATDQEVKDFLKYVTGSSSFALNSRIDIVSIRGNAASPICALACYNQLNLSDGYYQDPGDTITDSTKEGFLTMLKAVMVGDSYSQS